MASRWGFHPLGREPTGKVVDEMVKKFKPPPPAPEWATLVPSRRPEFKIHNKRSHAINALKVYNPPRTGTIYQWDPEVREWVEWFSYERPTECCLCGLSFQDRRAGVIIPMDYKADPFTGQYAHHKCKEQYFEGKRA